MRNAFRPETIFELIDAFTRARNDARVGVVLFTGEGPHAFCSGGDQRVRGDEGYVGEDGVPRLNVLDLQKLIRAHAEARDRTRCGLRDRRRARAARDLRSHDRGRERALRPDRAARRQLRGGLGSGYLARIVGQKKAREIWYLCRQYDAAEASRMGLVNSVVPLEQLEATGVAWGRRILEHSPLAIRCLKSAFNADCDGQVGLQELAGNATLLFYMSEEAQEGRNAFVEKRQPDFARFPWRP